MSTSPTLTRLHHPAGLGRSRVLSVHSDVSWLVCSHLRVVPKCLVHPFVLSTHPRGIRVRSVTLGSLALPAGEFDSSGSFRGVLTLYGAFLGVFQRVRSLCTCSACP